MSSLAFIFPFFSFFMFSFFSFFHFFHFFNFSDRAERAAVFYVPESGGIDSALVRVASLDTDLLPSPLSLVTVALLPLIFLHFSFACVLVVGPVSEVCSNWR